VAELEALGHRFNGRSILDPTLISDMQQAYGGSGWIKKVVKMRRRFPNRVELEFHIRVPAAQVWHDRRYWLVDADATLLPVDGSAKPFPSLPAIVGVTSRVIGGRPASGEEWNDEGVRGALGVMRAFWGSPLGETLPVGRVVVNAGAFQEGGASEGRRRFEIVSEDGVIVRWGTYNAGNVSGELKSAEKLWNLQELLRSEEALAPGVCFDVRTALPGFTLLE
jgi:hypothetical protein